jgi:tetratricopeptide (TPR) repeat protein
VAHHQEALTLFEELGDRSELANTLDLLGMASLLGADHCAAVQHYSRAIPLCRELGDRPRLAASLMGRASSVSMLIFRASVPPELPHDPRRDIDDARRIAEEIDLASERIWAHWGLGLVLTLGGRFGPALEELEIALKRATEIEHREWEAAVRFALGNLYLEIFASSRALETLEEGLALAREMHSPLWIHSVSGALAATQMALGDRQKAREHLERVFSPETPMDTLGKRYCWAQRVELALAEDDPRLALETVERLIASAPGIGSAPGMGPGPVIPYLWKLKAEALAALGRPDDAASLLYAAVEQTRSAEERYLRWRTHAALARVYRATGCGEAAEGELAAARALINESAATVADPALQDRFRQRAYQITRRAGP